MDQILGEIYLLLGKRKAVSRESLRIDEAYLLGKDLNLVNEFLRVHIWLAAMQAFVEDELVEFLNNAIVFFLDGSDHMYQAWQAIVEALREVSKTISPNNTIILSTEK
jgi:hypothetical protein